MLCVCVGLLLMMTGPASHTAQFIALLGTLRIVLIIAGPLGEQLLIKAGNTGRLTHTLYTRRKASQETTRLYNNGSIQTRQSQKAGIRRHIKRSRQPLT